MTYFPNLRAASLGLLAALLFACDSGSGSSRPVSPAVLDPGDAWTYDITLTQSMLDENAVDTLAAMRGRMKVTDTDAQLKDRTGLVVLETFPLSTPDSVNRTWYSQSPDSLVDVAYSLPLRGPRIGTLQRGDAGQGNLSNDALVRRLTCGMSGLPVLVRRRLATAKSRESAKARKKALREGLAPDSIRIRDDPRVVLKAPLRKGTSWISFEDPFLSKRTVAGRKTVETRAGRFRAVEVVNTFPETAPSLRWSDYYTEEGLVRRVVTDTVQVRNPDGTVEGQALQREVYDLVSRED
ncbi:MAG: hypothetical protein ABEL51_05445 [Salinibacter sp.]